MNRIRNTSQRLVEVLVFYRKKNIKLQPVTPLMPLEALLIPVNPTNGINGGTGCNFIFFISPCSLSWPHLHIFLAQIWHVALQGPSNDHLHIRFFIRHIVSPWWHMGGFS